MRWGEAGGAVGKRKPPLPTQNLRTIVAPADRAPWEEATVTGLLVLHCNPKFSVVPSKSPVSFLFSSRGNDSNNNNHTAVCSQLHSF